MITSQCVSCDEDIRWDVDQYCGDEAGQYHEACYEAHVQRRMYEAQVLPHPYRVNTNAAYERGHYKNEEWMESLL